MHTRQDKSQGQDQLCSVFQTPAPIFVIVTSLFKPVLLGDDALLQIFARAVAYVWNLVMRHVGIFEGIAPGCGRVR